MSMILKSKKFRAFFSKHSMLVLILTFVLGMIVHNLMAENRFRVILENGKLKISAGVQKTAVKDQTPQIDLAKLQEEVLPQSGYTFKVKWGNLGKRLVEDGVLDKVKLAKALTGTGDLPNELDKYLTGPQDQIELNSSNSQFWVDVLWGLGLANKNKILDEGPMVAGGNTANFASTGGYTLGVKKPMDVYSKYSYIVLTAEQQLLVDEIAGSIYRPCCGNSTAFPDCNHGMAALALVELMVSQGFPKEEIYKTVLAFNSYWFPQTYLDISYHFTKNGRDYKKVSPAEILSKTFSSAQGYKAVKGQIGEVAWPALKGGNGCGA